MKPIPRRRQRTFSLKISVPPLDDFAWDVVNSIECQSLAVANPNDDSALHEVFDSSGALLVDSDATLTVPLSDWLAVGCQRIRWENCEENELRGGACGMYHTNAPTVFGNPYDECEPLGPSAFVGEIILPRTIQRAYIDCHYGTQPVTDIVETFQFILAHELVHVFNELKYLVPAFMDWHGFFTNILNHGSSTDILYSRMQDKSCFIDHYGDPLELACIQDWWPSRAAKWFRSRDYDNSWLSKESEPKTP